MTTCTATSCDTSVSCEAALARWIGGGPIPRAVLQVLGGSSRRRREESPVPSAPPALNHHLVSVFGVPRGLVACTALDTA
eukprot:7389582-Prymnesium_polylepis.1